MNGWDKLVIVHHNDIETAKAALGYKGCIA